MSYHKHHNNGRLYTEEEKRKIEEAYKINIYKDNWLEKLSHEIHKPKTSICKYAQRHGWTDRKRTVFDENEIYINYTCIICNKIFIRKRYEPRKTCSDKCYIKYEKINCKKKFIKWHSEHEHPRGMLGKTHNKKNRKQMSKRLSNMWNDPNSVLNSEKYREKISKRMSISMVHRLKTNPSNIYSRTQKGWLEFGDEKKYYFRSKWEMNYALYLEFLKKRKQIQDWTYEDDTFWFDSIKRGVRSYTPDFKILNKKGTIEYHEVKGWMDAKSKTKLSRMKKYYPSIKIILIDEDYYRALKKNSRLFNFR